MEELTDTRPWAELPDPALTAIGRLLSIIGCLSARQVCRSWCEGISASIMSLNLTPGLISTHGEKAVAKALERMSQVETIDVATGPHQYNHSNKVQGSTGLGVGQPPPWLGGSWRGSETTHTRPYTLSDVTKLFSVLAQHRPGQKLPAIYIYTESLNSKLKPGVLYLQKSWRQAVREGLADLAPCLSSLRLSDPGLITEDQAMLTQLTGLEMLELNLADNKVDWPALAQLPALHSLVLVPPTSPHSSGHGPEHAQQVVPTLLSFSVPITEVLQALKDAGAHTRFKQLLLQQTGDWDDASAKLLHEFTSLQSLRLFPGPNTPSVLWEDLAPMCKLSELEDLQLVGYTPVKFTRGSATGDFLSAALPKLRSLELVVEPEGDQVAAVAALTQLTRLKLMLQPQYAMEGMTDQELPGGLGDVILQHLQGVNLPGVVLQGGAQGGNAPGPVGPPDAQGAPPHNQHVHAAHAAAHALIHQVGVGQQMQFVFPGHQLLQQQQQQQQPHPAPPDDGPRDQVLEQPPTPAGGPAAAAAAATSSRRSHQPPGQQQADEAVEADEEEEEEITDVLHPTSDAAAQEQAEGLDWDPSQQLTCLGPLVELRGLKSLELLSPLMPITDAALEFLFVKQQRGEDQAIASAPQEDKPRRHRSDSGVIYQPALPELTSLAMSGVVHVSRSGQRTIRAAYPNLKDLLLMHARPGDAPFDFDGDAAGPFGMLAAMGQLGPPPFGHIMGLPMLFQEIQPPGQPNHAGFAAAAVPAPGADVPGMFPGLHEGGLQALGPMQFGVMQVDVALPQGPVGHAAAGGQGLPEQQQQQQPQQPQQHIDIMQHVMQMLQGLQQHPADGQQQQQQQDPAGGQQQQHPAGGQQQQQQQDPAGGQQQQQAHGVQVHHQAILNQMIQQMMQHLNVPVQGGGVPPAGPGAAGAAAAGGGAAAGGPVPVGAMPTVHVGGVLAGFGPFMGGQQQVAAGDVGHLQAPPAQGLGAVPMVQLQQQAQQPIAAGNQIVSSIDWRIGFHAGATIAFTLWRLLSSPQPGMAQPTGLRAAYEQFMQRVADVAIAHGCPTGDMHPLRRLQLHRTEHGQLAGVLSATLQHMTHEQVVPLVEHMTDALAADGVDGFSVGSLYINGVTLRDMVMGLLDADTTAARQGQFMDMVTVLAGMGIQAGAGSPQQLAAGASLQGLDEQQQAAGEPGNPRSQARSILRYALIAAAVNFTCGVLHRRDGEDYRAVTEYLGMRPLADADQQQQQPPLEGQGEELSGAAAAAGDAEAAAEEVAHAQVPLVGQQPEFHIPFFGHPANDLRSFIAPHKIAAEDLPSNLRQLQLLNVGFKSSKKPLPCADLHTLMVERCKSARAFRLPDISRCSQLVHLHLVNVYLEKHTLQSIASCCPLVQRITLADLKAFSVACPFKSASVVTSIMHLGAPQQLQPHAQPDGGPGLGAAAPLGGGGGGAHGPQQGDPQQQQQQPGQQVRVTRRSQTPQRNYEAQDVDWEPLGQLKCLHQFMLKGHHSQVLAAAQQLAACRHQVKNLQLEAQGVPAPSLQDLGDNLVTLPYLTWLTLDLAYIIPPGKRTRSAAPNSSAAASSSAAAADAGRASSSSNSSTTSVPGSGGPTSSKAAAELHSPPLAERVTFHDNAPRSIECARHEPGRRLKGHLVNTLPSTVLKLRVAVHA